MAQRRMFSRKITESDAFVDMPLSSQCLYFHIAMAADDDGFVEGVNRIRRSIGASEDDLKLLIAKSFLIPFDSGVVVVRQWHVHNYIQKDRYVPTTHTEEKARLTILETGEKGAYVLAYEQMRIPVNIGVNTDVHEMYPECIQDVSTGKVRDRVRDRDRSGKDSPNVKKRQDNNVNQRRDRAGARTRGNEFADFSEDGDDEEDKPIGHDGNWRRSPRARAATAQLVVNRMAEERLPLANYGEIFDKVYEAMEGGIAPEEILAAARQLDPCEFTMWQARMIERRRDEWRGKMRQEEAAYEARRRQWEQGEKTPEELERLRLAYSGMRSAAPADDDDEDDYPF